jgi:hypothetical protein
MAIIRAEALLRALASQDPMSFSLVKGEDILLYEELKIKEGTVNPVFKYVMTSNMIIAYNDPDAIVTTSTNETAYLYKINGYVQE